MAQKQPEQPKKSQSEPDGETAKAPHGHVNGIDVDALDETVRELEAHPAKAIAEFGATTSWTGSLHSVSHIEEWHLGGERIPQHYSIEIDEPVELLGSGKAPNPQMFLQAAINACMLNTFVAAAAVMGVELESLEFESSGELDLRGFLGIDESVDAGYQNIELEIRVKGEGTREQYEKMWELVQKQSPNYFNTTEPIPIDAEITIED